MKQASLTIFLFLFLSVLVKAQSDTEDVIYFKNGGILRGEIIEYIGNESLKIRTMGRNVFVVRMEEVREITEEEIPPVRHYKTSGYINRTGISILPGVGDHNLRFQMVNGYRFSPRLSAGLGIGFVSYNDPLNLLPFFLDLKFKLVEANTAPFIFLRSGYGFSVEPSSETEIEDHRGGWMINPGIGLQFDTRAGFGWYLAAGYNSDRYHFSQRRWDGRVVENKHIYRRIQFGFGLSF